MHHDACGTDEARIPDDSSKGLASRVRSGFPLFITSMPRMRFNAPMASKALGVSVSRKSAFHRKPRQGLVLPQAQHAVTRANTFFRLDADACCSDDIKTNYAFQNFSGTFGLHHGVAHARPVSSCYGTLADCSNCKLAAAPNPDTTLRFLHHMR